MDEALIPSVSEREPGWTGDVLGASAGLREQGVLLCARQDRGWEMLGSHRCALKAVGFHVCKETGHKVKSTLQLAWDEELSGAALTCRVQTQRLCRVQRIVPGSGPGWQGWVC